MLPLIHTRQLRTIELRVQLMAMKMRQNSSYAARIAINVNIAFRNA
jgi:hypothetical protein